MRGATVIGTKGGRVRSKAFTRSAMVVFLVLALHPLREVRAAPFVSPPAEHEWQETWEFLSFAYGYGTAELFLSVKFFTYRERNAYFTILAWSGSPFSRQGHLTMGPRLGYQLPFGQRGRHEFRVGLGGGIHKQPGETGPSTYNSSTNTITTCSSCSGDGGDVMGAALVPEVYYTYRFTRWFAIHAGIEAEVYLFAEWPNVVGFAGLAF